MSKTRSTGHQSQAADEWSEIEKLRLAVDRLRVGLNSLALPGFESSGERKLLRASGSRGKNPTPPGHFASSAGARDLRGVVNRDWT